MVNILDYGAVADGKTINTLAIQGAVDACYTAGGGEVVVPRGVFCTGSVELKSNITLRLEQGAVLKGSGEIVDYPPNRFVHNEWKETRSILYAIDAVHVRITGDGEMDLSGDDFMHWDILRPGPEIADAAMLNEMQRSEVVVRAKPRPTQLIFFHNCRQVAVDSVRIANSPCWTIIFSCCRDVKVHGITIENHLQIPNCDGIHLCSSTDVTISDCNIKAGDDCIAITGITDWGGISERIAISNCNFISKSAGVRIGFLESKVRHVVINNLTITGSNRGIGIFAGDGGWVEDVVIANITMDTHLFAGEWWGRGEPLMISAADSSGRICRISMNHVRARAENSIVLVGKSGNVSDIALCDWRLEVAPGYNRPQLGKLIDLSPVAPRAAPEDCIPWLYAEDVCDVYVENFRYRRIPGSMYGIDAVVKGVDGFRLRDVEESHSHS